VACEFEDNDEQLLQFISDLMPRLRATPAYALDDIYFRHALEHRSLMSESKQERIQDLDAIAETAADLLAEQGATLVLTDIRMLSNALEEYGCRPDLSYGAAKASLDDWLKYSFNEAVDEATSVQELEEIRSELSKLTDYVDIKLGETHSAAMDVKRRQLLEDEESRESEGYQTSQWKAPGQDFSDEQVRSLFSTILD
jgi:hypothetical protein